MKQFGIICNILLFCVPLALQAGRMAYNKIAPNAKELVRYGYSGQEKECELKSKKYLYNYRARMYDPQLRKFLSPDKAKQQFGAYVFCGNNPLSFVDMNGKKFYFPQQEYEQKFREVLAYLKTLGSEEREMIERLETDKTFTIRFFFDRGRHKGNHFSSSRNQITITGIVSAIPFSSQTYTLHSGGVASGLLHELWHADGFNFDKEAQLARYKKKYSKEDKLFLFDNEEEFYVIQSKENFEKNTMNFKWMKDGKPFIYCNERITHYFGEGLKYEAGNWITSEPRIGGILITYIFEGGGDATF